MGPYTAVPGPAPKPLRGEIWEINPPPSHGGREVQKSRPALVVSTDALNQSDFGTVIVCPITTTRRDRFGWRPGLAPDDLRIADAKWKAEPHWVMTDQIVTIDTQGRLIRHLATVTSARKLQEVAGSLRMLLDLDQ